MNKPVAFIVVENGQTWLRTTAETEEAIRTGFITETIPLYKQREPLSDEQLLTLYKERYHQKPNVDVKNSQKRNDIYLMMRAVEKAHGIEGES